MKKLKKIKFLLKQMNCVKDFPMHFSNIVRIAEDLNSLKNQIMPH